MRRGHQAHRRAVGLKLNFLKRLDEVGEHGLTFFLEVGKVGHFRQLARGPQNFEDLAEQRLGQQPVAVEIEQLGVGAVEEFELLIGSENDDGGGQSFNHRRMGLDMLVQGPRSLFRIGHVKADADGFLAERGLGDF